MRISVGSAKHSPGATTLCLALACALAEDRDEGPPLLIEADPAGGDLAALLGLPTEPGLATLAAAARHDHEPGEVWRHARPLPAGGAVLLAPMDPLQCRAALNTIGPRLPSILESERLDAVVDFGRYGGDAADRPTGFDVRIVVCRPDVAGVEHARALAGRMSTGGGDRASEVVVLVGDRPYGPADVRSVVPTAFVASVPWDHAGVLALLTGPSRRARRSALVRGVRTMLDDLAGVRS